MTRKEGTREPEKNIKSKDITVAARTKFPSYGKLMGMAIKAKKKHATGERALGSLGIRRYESSSTRLRRNPASVDQLTLR